MATSGDFHLAVDIEQAAQGMRRRKVLVREVLADVTGGSTTRAEATFARAWRSRPGLPPLRTQLPFRQADGRPRFIDAAVCPDDVPGLRAVIGVEFEGIGHTEAGTHHDDVQRQAEALRQGILLIRMTNDDVLDAPHRAVDVVLGTIRSWGGRL